MDIQMAKNLKNELEVRLAMLIDEELKIFSKNTGLIVDSIHVNPVYTSYLGSENKDLVATSVEVRIEI